MPVPHCECLTCRSLRGLDAPREELEKELAAHRVTVASEEARVDEARRQERTRVFDAVRAFILSVRIRRHEFDSIEAGLAEVDSLVFLLQRELGS